jgi:cupin 2 domain-containing protein
MKNSIFANIPKELPDELFDELFSNKTVKIERIISKGHTSPKSGWYDQEENEWVLLVKGEALLEFENEKVHLKEGDYINIPPYTKHKVAWTEPNQETIWLAVFYKEEKL